MAFDSLTEKLQNVFKNLRSKGRLSETDVKQALREVKVALLEADVNFKVVRDFIKKVQERAVGQDVMNGLNPGQMVVKIVNEELTQMMGGEAVELSLKPPSETTILMLAGLQGAGKTTTAAKLAGKLQAKGRKPLLVACDVYRPAAAKQLQINGEKLNIPVFIVPDSQNPVEIAQSAIAHAKEQGYNLVILDTAGRLHVDEEMMQELADIKQGVAADQTILVVDAMTGQDAVNVAESFREKIGLDGLILTKLDGDARGGAALSIRAVTNTPVLYVGMGEKLSELEPFHPDRMASRILGMGDILSLIEKAESEIDEDKAKEMSRKFTKAQFDFDDYMESMQQMQKMGGLSSVMGMLGGMGGFGGMAGRKTPAIDSVAGEQQMAKMEAMILSMTPEERQNPDLLNPSRKNRIAAGSGLDIATVNRMIKQFHETRKMMKKMPNLLGGNGGKRGRYKFPF